MRSDGPMGPRRAFTLIELMIVIVIIGILIGFVLSAATAGVRRAEERATQSLIMKLEIGLNDRIDALLSIRATPTVLHQAMASIYDSTGNALFTNDPLAAAVRSQVIAQYDMMRAEVPDVFYLPTSSTDPGFDSTLTSLYPINFGARVMNVSSVAALSSSNNLAMPLGAPVDPNGLSSVAIIGENGASFTAAAGIYKNAGYLPQGYDGLNNDPTNNTLIDDSVEGDPLSAAMSKHRHSTARSEMLYALLVEGQGPLGSVFSADDFTTKEVQDTDGDGLPEFVDAWGQPLQFFRWPIYYHSEVQKGCFATSDVSPFATTFGYNGAIEPREQDTLDPNQQLMAPRWWSSANNGDPTGTITSLIGAHSGSLSAGAVAFQKFFHDLVDPNATAASVNNWDRGSTYFQRRAYYTKFLILSGGPDREPGVFLYPDGTTLDLNMIMEESKALPRNVNTPTTPPATMPSYAFSLDTDDAALDDITNHNIQAAGGSIQ